MPPTSVDRVSAASSRPVRLAVGVVGCGRVGSALGAALRRAGHDIVAVSAVSEASRRRAGTALPGVPVRGIPDVVQAADLVLLAVPDDVLAPLVSGLATAGFWRPGQVVAHTSGRHGLAVLEPATDSGVVPMALHPAMTFTGSAADVERVGECCFGITAPQGWRPMAKSLVIEIGSEPLWVADADRSTYHAGLAHGANHLVTLIAQAMEILGSTGIERPDRLLRPLVEAALDNALRAGDAALTGPVSRGDVGTVEVHLGELSRQAPDILMAYRAMARATLQRAVRAGRLRTDLALPIVDLLEEPT